MNDNNVEFAVLLFIALVLIGLTSLVLPMGFNKQMRAECYTWKAQAEEYRGFYLTDWQKDQCDDMGVEIIVK